MQLNQATDYAFRIVLYLAGLQAGEVISGVTIAESQNIPRRFIQKIMRSLMTAGLVKSYRGVEGGFSLAKPAAEISLLDIIVGMEGPLGIHRCLAERNVCTRSCERECPVHQALAAVQERLAADLSSIDFAALAANSKLN
ncbi:Rrf2 family transcriptional regulator [Sporomusa aerivorans]|uniref:RrF2 family transcriptional regulator n=1 Tax=Sporomusa aerivorans TaxID=204936 RepID=UPI00352A3E8B